MSITGSNHLLQLIIPLVKQHIKLIHNIIVKTPSSRSTGLRNLFAERENKQDIQKDVLFVLVEISGIEPLTSWMPFKRSPEPIGYIPPQLGLWDALQYATPPLTAAKLCLVILLLRILLRSDVAINGAKYISAENHIPLRASFAIGIVEIALHFGKQCKENRTNKHGGDILNDVPAVFNISHRQSSISPPKLAL